MNNSKHEDEEDDDSSPLFDFMKDLPTGLLIILILGALLYWPLCVAKEAFQRVDWSSIKSSTALK